MEENKIIGCAVRAQPRYKIFITSNPDSEIYLEQLRLLLADEHIDSGREFVKRCFEEVSFVHVTEEGSFEAARMSGKSELATTVILNEAGKKFIKPKIANKDKVVKRQENYYRQKYYK